MIKNKVLNKCCSMLVALIVTLSLILPSMLMPQDVYKRQVWGSRYTLENRWKNMEIECENKKG